MIKFSNVKNILKNNIKPINGMEWVSISNSTNRYLATEIISRINVPPKDNSAVDGFVFNYKQFSKSKKNDFKICGEINAGKPFKNENKLDSFFRISTGAQTPLNFDSVIMQENVIIKENAIRSLKGIIRKGMNVRKKGEDIKSGQLVFSKGHKLRPQDVGMLASLGISKVKVMKKLKIGILSNGDELVEPGIKKKNFQIYDVNRYILKSFLDNQCVKCIDFKIVKDDARLVLKRMIKIKEKCDLLIITGGASTGKKDYISSAIEKIGALNFWKVSIKPGRPFGFGVLTKNKPVLMIPGNPVASFTIFFIFGRYLINYMLGNNKFMQTSFKVKSNFEMKKKKGREEFLRARVFLKDNTLFANKFKTQGAGILNSLVWANGLLRLEEKIEKIKKNDLLDFFPFDT